MEFDEEDEVHLLYVQAYANLLAFNCGIEGVDDIGEVKGMVGNVEVEEFKV